MSKLRRRTRVSLCLLASTISFLMLGGVARAAGPTFTTPPTIAGTAAEGQTLTLTQPANWTYTATFTVSDAWAYCTTTCTPIASATGPRYTLTAPDVGKTIGVIETAAATDGTSGTANSNQIGPVFGNVALPSIPGTPQQGQPVTVQPGSWTPSPTSPPTYEWRQCNSAGTSCTTPIGNRQTYTPIAADVGHMVEVVETATANGTSLTATSSPAGPVLPPPPTHNYPPWISGTFQQGQTLTVQQGDWTSNGQMSIIDEWDRCDSAGANCAQITTGTTYTLTPSDVGSRLRVLETATNAGGRSTAYSPPTQVITIAVQPSPVPPVPPVASTIALVASPSSPMANQTVTLVATVIFGSGNANPSGSVTFFDGSSAITGCANQRVQATGQSATLVCPASFPAGTVALGAVFTPDAGTLVAGSASPRTALVVSKDQTSTSLAVTKQVVRAGRATYSAQVVLPVSNSGPVQPIGSIEFLDGAQPIRGCLSRPLSQQTATCTARYKSLGKHKISAVYSGDANFAPSTSPTRLVDVVKSSSQPIVLGFISSTLQWQFVYHPAFTLVTTLMANGILPGTSVRVTCQGGGCPFGRRAIASRANRSINLLPAFRNHHLRTGSQVTLRFMRPHWIGKYYSFTVRRGQAPVIVLSCLGVGRTRPGVGC